MRANIHIIAYATTNIPEDVSVKTLYVINDEKVWVTDLREESRLANFPSIDLSAGGGPKWGPDILVDVVVSVLDDSRERRFLRETEVSIEGDY